MNRREKILNAQDIKSEVITVAEWGVDVEVRGLTLDQRAKVIEGARNEDGTQNDTKVHVPLVIATAHDPETKQPIFTAADRDALGSKSAQAVDQVASVALRLSGMSQPEQETIRKNFSGTPSDGPTSA